VTSSNEVLVTALRKLDTQNEWRMGGYAATFLGTMFVLAGWGAAFAMGHVPTLLHAILCGSFAASVVAKKRLASRMLYREWLQTAFTAIDRGSSLQLLGSAIEIGDHPDSMQIPLDPQVALRMVRLQVPAAQVVQVKRP